MMKMLKKLIIAVVIFISILYSLETITDGDLYDALIRLSIIPVLLAPFFLQKVLKIHISEYSEIIYTIFITLAHFLGSIVNLYDKVLWYDTFTHFLSGFVFSFFILEIFIRIDKFQRKDFVFNIVFILSVSFMIACCWEIFEFTCDQLFGKDAQKVLTTGVTDTMKDMIVAVLGASLFCLFYAYEHINRKKLLIQKFIVQIK